MFRTDTIALRKIMIERGYNTISSLANDAGIDRNTLSKVLNGVIQPSAPIMYSLVETLGIEPERAGSIFFASDLRIA